MIVDKDNNDCLPADLLDGVHGPNDIEVLVPFDDLLVHDAHVRLPASVETSEKASPIHQIISTCYPEC